MTAMKEFKRPRAKSWTGDVKKGDVLASKTGQPRLVEVLSVTPTKGLHAGRFRSDATYVLRQIWPAETVKVSTVQRVSLPGCYQPEPIMDLVQACRRLNLRPEHGRTRGGLASTAKDYLINQRVPTLRTSLGEMVQTRHVERLAEEMRPKVQQAPEAPPAKIKEPAQQELALHPVLTTEQLRHVADRVCLTLEEGPLVERIADAILGDRRLIDVIARTVLAALDAGTAADNDNAEAFVSRVRAIVAGEDGGA